MITHDFRYKDFETIRVTKLQMNNHKTMNVSLENFIDKLQEEYREAITAYIKWLDTRPNLDERRLKEQAFSAELADLANMCYLTYMKIRGYKE